MHIIHLSDLRLSDKTKDNATVVCQGIVDKIKALTTLTTPLTTPTTSPPTTSPTPTAPTPPSSTPSPSPPSPTLTSANHTQPISSTANHTTVDPYKPTDCVCIMTGLMFDANITPHMKDITVLATYIKSISNLCPILIFNNETLGEDSTNPIADYLTGAGNTESTTSLDGVEQNCKIIVCKAYVHEVLFIIPSTPKTIRYRGVSYTSMRYDMAQGAIYPLTVTDGSFKVAIINSRYNPVNDPSFVGNSGNSNNSNSLISPEALISIRPANDPFNVRHVLPDRDLYVCGGRTHDHIFDPTHKVSEPGAVMQASYIEDIDKGINIWDSSAKYIKFEIVKPKTPYLKIVLCDNARVRGEIGDAKDPQDVAGIIIEYKRCSAAYVNDFTRLYTTIYNRYPYVKNVDTNAMSAVNNFNKMTPLSDEQYVTDEIIKLAQTQGHDAQMIKDLLSYHDHVVGTYKATLPTSTVIQPAYTGIVRRWKLKSMRWSNMLCYGASNHIDFQQMSNIIGIIAPNMSGKSSIFDILVYGLFGMVIRGDKSTMSRRSGKEIADGAIVIVELICSGTTYKIERTDDKIAVTIDDVTEYLSSNKDSTNYLTPIIGTYEDFIMTSFICQDNVTDFVHIDPVRRMGFINMVSGLHILLRYEKIAAKENKSITIPAPIKNVESKKIDTDKHRIYMGKLEVMKKTLEEKLVVVRAERDRKLKAVNIEVYNMMEWDNTCLCCSNNNRRLLGLVSDAIGMSRGGGSGGSGGSGGGGISNKPRTLEDIDEEIEGINKKLKVIAAEFQKEFAEFKIDENDNARLEAEAKDREGTRIINQQKKLIISAYQNILGLADGIHRVLLDEILETIQDEMNIMLGKLFTSQTNIEQDTKFEIELTYNNGINIDMIRGKNKTKLPIILGSGYQKFIVSIVFRICFTKMFNGPNAEFIIIDEGFTCLDKDNIISVRQFLEFVQHQFSFMIIISHLEQLIPIFKRNILIGFAYEDTSLVSHVGSELIDTLSLAERAAILNKIKISKVKKSRQTMGLANEIAEQITSGTTSTPYNTTNSTPYNSTNPTTNPSNPSQTYNSTNSLSNPTQTSNTSTSSRSSMPTSGSMAYSDVHTGYIDWVNVIQSGKSSEAKEPRERREKKARDPNKPKIADHPDMDKRPDGTYYCNKCSKDFKGALAAAIHLSRSAVHR